MIEYVLGFAFIGDNVVLIEKQRPDWQRGFLNGVGGKIEPFDHDIDEAMAREFFEETGVKTTPQDWVHFAKIRGADFVIFAFYVDLTPDAPVRTTTDETVFVVPINDLGLDSVPTLPNVPFLTQMAISVDVRAGNIELPIEIFYK